MMMTIVDNNNKTPLCCVVVLYNNILRQEKLEKLGEIRPKRDININKLKYIIIYLIIIEIIIINKKGEKMETTATAA